MPAVRTDCDHVLLALSYACHCYSYCLVAKKSSVVMQEAAQVRDELKEVVMQQMEEAIAKTSSTAVTHGIKVCAKRCAGWVWACWRRPAQELWCCWPSCGPEALEPHRHQCQHSFSGLAALWEAACKMPLPATDPLH